MQDYIWTCNTRQYKWVSVRREHRASAWQGKDARQASRAFNTCEDGADEDGVEAEMYESSEHFRVAHDGWVR
jgi:hypothetical protein